jgi:CheY-like chemotaxis protein
MNETKYPDFTGKRILVAEDNQLNFKLIETILSRTNATFYWAKNGVEAVDLSIKNELDLVLMDIRMPEMDGLAASKLIKKYYPDLNIVAVTAFTSSEDVEHIFNAGITEYVSKPINQEKFIQMLEKYLIK